jgi:hypothetical protein
MDDLRDLTMGVYQLKQAPQYTREHTEPEYELFLVKDDPNLIRCKIPMRARTSICCAKASPCASRLSNGGLLSLHIAQTIRTKSPIDVT